MRFGQRQQAARRKSAAVNGPCDPVFSGNPTQACAPAGAIGGVWVGLLRLITKSDCGDGSVMSSSFGC